LILVILLPSSGPPLALSLPSPCSPLTCIAYFGSFTP
jgi:hypothetical protein